MSNQVLAVQDQLFFSPFPMRWHLALLNEIQVASALSSDFSTAPCSMLRPVSTFQSPLPLEWTKACAGSGCASSRGCAGERPSHRIRQGPPSPHSDTSRSSLPQSPWVRRRPRDAGCLECRRRRTSGGSSGCAVCLPAAQGRVW